MTEVTCPSFTLPRPDSGPIRRALTDGGLQLIEKLFSLRRCQEIYSGLKKEDNDLDFPARVLKELRVDYRVGENDLERIPETGPVVVVANHPYGAIEGVILMDLIRRRRQDVKFLANYLLNRIDEVSDMLINVDPFGGKAAARANVSSLRSARSWLENGGLLVIFPGGEVSSWKPGRGVVDPDWNPNIARIIRRAGVPVVPIHISGCNGPIFQGLGLLHPKLRTALLPKELLNKRGRCIELRIGRAISTERINACTDDREAIDYLRHRTYLLRGISQRRTLRNKTTGQPELAPLAEAIRPSGLETELTGLPPESLLLTSGDYQVYAAGAADIPLTLLEIGRLREKTFRNAGEGTGQPRDLDLFDENYQHLFIWHRTQQCLVGAYRLGATDQLLPKFGARGLYSSTLFDYRQTLLDRITPGLELGRSFVVEEYQKSYAPLLLLWKGIGAYLVRHPHYRFLFGPVSISRDYSEAARRLMTASLSHHYLVKDLASLVEPKLPVSVKPLPVKGAAPHSPRLGRDLDEISELVADLETDIKGIPVLMRHYLNLGGKLLAFNLDPNFSDVIDGLLLIDLPLADVRQMKRYLGNEGWTAFRQYHQDALNDRHCA